MASLELRFGRNQELIPWWYGRYKTWDNRRKLVNLEVAICGEPPASLRVNDKGDARFEDSRSAAQAKLEKRIDKENKGRVDKATAFKAYRDQTGGRLKDTRITDLPKTLETILANSKQQSDGWKEWKAKVVADFSAWGDANSLRTVLDVNQETATKYLTSIYKPEDKDKYVATIATVRKVKMILGRVFDRALPEGAPNPFRSKDVNVARAEGDREYNRVPLNQKEVVKLLETAKQEDPLIYELIVCALSTGLRRGDVCTIRWKGVDLEEDRLEIITSKTDKELFLPILPLFKTVLETRLLEKKTKSEYVFPDAAHLLEESPAALSYRIKKVFVHAFAPAHEDSELVRLADVLPQVLEIVSTKRMVDSKRKMLLGILNRYAKGESYTAISAATGKSKGGISTMLHTVQKWSELKFIPDAPDGKSGIRAQVDTLTRVERKFGTRHASKYDFHALRTTFVTLALSAGIGVEVLKALTGHATVEIVMRHYFKPKGSDFADQLTKAMPAVLTATPNALKRIAGKRKIGEVIPEKVSEALRFIETLKLTKEERESLLGLI
jgi:integrase